MTKISLILAAAILAACNPTAPHSPADRTPKMDKPSSRVEKLFAETKPVCFGRFVINVPKTAQVVWGPTNVGDTIVSYPDEGIRVLAEIRDKVGALKEEKHLREPSTYIGTFDGPNPESKVVVGYASFESSGRTQLHSYIRLGKHAFVQSAPSAVLDELPDGSDDKTSYRKRLAELQDTARRLRVRDESEIPGEPGICIEAGFVADGSVFDTEMSSIGFRFPELPDVTFSIQTQNTDRVDDSNSLEWSVRKGREYANAIGKGDLYSNAKVMRKGSRVIGDWQGAELLGRMPAQKPGAPSVHEFLYKSVGVAGDRLRPIIDMDLHTGVEKNAQGVHEPSLTDDEAVTLWDKLTTSIRARPNGVGAGQSTAPAVPAPAAPPRPKTGAVPAVPIGTQLASGMRCPQTGIWVCDETTALGSTRRAFNAGETLPSVIVPVARTFLQKVKGAPKNVLQQSVWTLVALRDPEDT